MSPIEYESPCCTSGSSSSGPFQYIDFLTGLADPPYSEGRVFYDDTNQTIAIYNGESEITQQLGQEIFIRVYNDTGGLITNGSLVYLNGVGAGDLPKIELAQADSSSTAFVLAMATHPIEDQTAGFCTVFGTVRNLNTLSWAPGTRLYLSATVPGSWTATAPTGPSFPIRVGTVTKQDVSNGEILISIGPTDVVETMVIHAIDINEDLRIGKRIVMLPSTVIPITASVAIPTTSTTMLIVGDGGPVEMTANPQIEPGINGQIVYLHGSDDTNVVIIRTGNGLHLHSGSKLILGKHDLIMLQYLNTTGLWEEVSNNFQTFDTNWSFVGPQGWSGTSYVGGFYNLPATSYTPAGGTALGSTNSAAQAHAFIVLGAASTDMVVRITGTSVDEEGTRVASDTEDLDTSGGSTNDYFETVKKWVGQVTVSLQSGTGVVINHGMCKYWDNQNSDFRVMALEVTGRAGANDSNPNLAVIHHRPFDWTYGGGSGAIPPAFAADMNTDFGVESEFVNGEDFTWKRTNWGKIVKGSGKEGMISVVVTTSNSAIETCNWTFSIRGN